MSLEERDFERVLRHCVEITSSIELEQVMEASSRAMRDLVPGGQVVLRLGSNGTIPSPPSDQASIEGVHFEFPLAAAGKVVGTLSVTSSPDPATEAERALVVSIAPAIAAALHNAVVVQGERAAWSRRRELEGQKSAFVARAALDLRRPLKEMRALAHALPGSSQTDVAQELHRRARELARVVEQVLDQSAREGADPGLYVDVEREAQEEPAHE